MLGVKPFSDETILTPDKAVEIMNEIAQLSWLISSATWTDVKLSEQIFNGQLRQIRTTFDLVMRTCYSAISRVSPSDGIDSTISALGDRYRYQRRLAEAAKIVGDGLLSDGYSDVFQLVERYRLETERAMDRIDNELDAWRRADRQPANLDSLCEYFGTKEVEDEADEHQ